MDSEDALREALAAKGWQLGEQIGTASAGTECDAEDAGSYMFPGGVIRCRCLICARCGHHTGNATQGHYWRHCKVTRTLREFHHCCDDPEFGCELEMRERLASEVRDGAG